MNTTYSSGPASLFSAAARQPLPTEPNQATCLWCFAKGPGKLIDINGYVVLDSHQDCIHKANLAEKCACFEKIGDNKDCLVHGWN
jgi:hypothetical protein